MGAYVCFDRHIHIGYETRTNGILSQLGYVDINEQMLNEIVSNKRLKWIQISECLPDEAYQKIDQILLVRPDITFRLFQFLNCQEIDISFLKNMPHMKRLRIDCIDFKSNTNRINLSVLAELSLKSLHMECFDLIDYEFIQNLSDELEELFIIYNEGGDTAWYDAQADGDVYAGKVYYKYKGTIAEGGTVNLKAGTKGIAGYAFLDQINLTGIEIPDSVTNIGDYAFVGCEKLNKVTVPASVTKIGEKALGYLTSGKGGQAYKLEGFTIRGVAGSAAEKYAKENEFNFEAYTPEYIRGDVDADRKVSIGDVRMTLRSICKKAELNGTQKLAADVEKDGTVDIKDLRKILRYVCGKIEYL